MNIQKGVQGNGQGIQDGAQDREKLTGMHAQGRYPLSPAARAALGDRMLLGIRAPAAAAAASCIAWRRVELCASPPAQAQVKWRILGLS